MKRISFVLLTLVLALGISSCGRLPLTQDPKSTERPSPTASIAPTITLTPQDTNSADAAFLSLLERVKRVDPTIDFTELRMAYAQTSQYDPYNFSIGELRNSMFTALDAQNYELALKLADDILTQNYIFTDAHLVATRAYENLGRTEEAKYHRYVLDGLIDSILQSGDGKTPESAFVVVLIEEEYVILAILQIADAGQSQRDIDGQSYDVFNGVDPQTNNPVELYFNIDIPFGALADSLKP
jgi:hypothetical protein